jgi:hypothetical protein
MDDPRWKGKTQLGVPSLQIGEARPEVRAVLIAKPLVRIDALFSAIERASRLKTEPSRRFESMELDQQLGDLRG